jgi:hypothetical protein
MVVMTTGEVLFPCFENKSHLTAHAFILWEINENKREKEREYQRFKNGLHPGFLQRIYS